ncbi:hypothetical protein [Nocardia gipuzkoensis]
MSWRAEPILDVALLAALPKDRALVRLPNHGPVVVRKIWWQHTGYAPLIRKSLARFEKAANQIALPASDVDNGPAGGEQS